MSAQPQIQTEINSTLDCETILARLDEELDEREKRIRITTKEHWKIKRTVARAAGRLFAKQVEQRPDGVCDSPFIQKIERYATEDLAVQGTDYDRIINEASRVVMFCQAQIDKIDTELAHANSSLAAPHEVRTTSAQDLDTATKNRIALHDEQVAKGHLQAEIAALEAKRKGWESTLAHAVTTRATAIGDKRHAETMVRANYCQQVMDHLKVANKDGRLASPFLLPGALAGTPILAENGKEETWQY